MYDATIGRWFTVDPLAEKYRSNSPYAFCGNNSVLLVDPNGEDFMAFYHWDKNDNLIGITIQSTIYVTGKRASKEKADELNQVAKTTFKSKKVDGVNISFNINYEYREDIAESDLGQGENLMTFVEETGRSAVTSKQTINGYPYDTGNHAIIFSNSSLRTTMHETGHLIGLSDRYREYDEDTNWKLPHDYAKYQKGYEFDLMSGNSYRLDISHYRHYMNALRGVGPMRPEMQGPIKRLIDRGTRGWMLNPYVPGGYHNVELDEYKK